MLFFFDQKIIQFVVPLQVLCFNCLGIPHLVSLLSNYDFVQVFNKLTFLIFRIAGIQIESFEYSSSIGLTLVFIQYIPYIFLIILVDTIEVVDSKCRLVYVD